MEVAHEASDDHRKDVPWTLSRPVLNPRSPYGRLPVQAAAYQLAVSDYIHPGDRILDVGFGLGYGLRMMAHEAEELCGIEIDRRAVSRGVRFLRGIPAIRELQQYDGCTIPYQSAAFDVVTCIDVLEHVHDYVGLIRELLRTSKRVVLISTPNRRPEYTMPDGRPRNRWHLREWSFEELDTILRAVPHIDIEWNFLSGPWEGPCERTSTISSETLALTPALLMRR